MITERKWVHFTTQPESVIITLVWELFVNASVKSALVVQARGKAVAYDSKTINSLF